MGEPPRERGGIIRAWEITAIALRKKKERKKERKESVSPREDCLLHPHVSLLARWWNRRLLFSTDV